MCGQKDQHFIPFLVQDCFHDAFFIWQPADHWLSKGEEAKNNISSAVEPHKIAIYLSDVSGAPRSLEQLTLLIFFHIPPPHFSAFIVHSFIVHALIMRINMEGSTMEYLKHGGESNYCIEIPCLTLSLSSLWSGETF